jgi:hypothetical protein
MSLVSFLGIRKFASIFKATYPFLSDKLTTIITLYMKSNMDKTFCRDMIMALVVPDDLVMMHYADVVEDLYMDPTEFMDHYEILKSNMDVLLTPTDFRTLIMYVDSDKTVIRCKRVTKNVILERSFWLDYSSHRIEAKFCIAFRGRAVIEDQEKIRVVILKETRCNARYKYNLVVMSYCRTIDRSMIDVQIESRVKNKKKKKKKKMFKIKQWCMEEHTDDTRYYVGMMPRCSTIVMILLAHGKLIRLE